MTDIHYSCPKKDCGVDDIEFEPSSSLNPNEGLCLNDPTHCMNCGYSGTLKDFMGVNEEEE